MYTCQGEGEWPTSVSPPAPRYGFEVHEFVQRFLNKFHQLEGKSEKSLGNGYEHCFFSFLVSRLP